MDALLCGGVLGAALTASGVCSPSVIISQRTFDHYHMLECFLAAAATSSVFVTVAQRTGYIDLQPRKYSSIGMFGRLDGNILGGLLQGSDMVLPDACAGTVFAQTRTGFKSSLYALGGAMLGVILWTGFIQPICHHNLPIEEIKEDCLRVDKRISLSETGTLMGLETMFSAIIGTVALSSAAKSRGLVNPVLGGLLIGCAQLLSIFVRKNLLETSTAFEELGNHFWWIVGIQTKPVSSTSIVFTSGMVLGAFILSVAAPVQYTLEIDLNPLRVVLGGIFLAIGSRMSNGCTSGYGISGVSLLSVSSFVTVAAMLTGGAAIAIALA